VRRLALLGALAAGCGGVDADPGLAADLRVANAQFFSGALPAPTTDAKITSIASLNNTIRAGQIGKALSGRMSHDGRAAAVAFASDAGYWIVPAGAMDAVLPDELTWSAQVSFAPNLADGPRVLQVSAVDAAGRFGSPETLTLTVRPHAVALDGTKLVVSLSWDTEADLDLHVVVPTSPPITVWAQHPTTYVVPQQGDPIDPNAIAAAGTLDADSNSQCRIDGQREENVIWHGPAAVPPHGSYAVLVDTFSLCAAPTAHWTVDVYKDGDMTSIAHAEGTVVDSDTRGDHVAGSGVRALVFDD
jgi:hypothetical protein